MKRVSRVGMESIMCEPFYSSEMDNSSGENKYSTLNEFSRAFV